MIKKENYWGLYKRAGTFYKPITKFFTWFYYGRKYASPINPFDIIYICPKKVRYIHNKPNIRKMASSGVLSGDWDKNYYPKEFKSNFEESLEKRINDKKPWEETRYFEDLLQSHHYDTYSKSEILSKLESYVDLYYVIKKNGYKSQTELTNTERVTISIHESPIRVKNEVTIDIGRDGQYIWFGGNHRLSITRMLDIDKIPVRVRVRHHKWQLKRDKIYQNKYESQFSHPDMDFDN